MTPKTILFDLDGTLTNPKTGIPRSVQYALRHFGIDEPDPDKLCPFIGPPLRTSFKTFYNFTDEEAAEGVQAYREYFAVKGIWENEVYEGIPELLKRLKEAGNRLMVATSKPEIFAGKILKHFDLDQWFEFVGGADLEETRVEKADVIRYVLEREHLAFSDHIVMVGDRSHDVLGAKANGIPTVGVLFGFGSEAELKDAGARWIVRDVRELGELLYRL